MKEPRCSQSQDSVAAQPPPLNPSQDRIQIYWTEDAGMVIKIRLHPVKVPAKSCGIPLKRGFSQGYNTPFASVAEIQIVSTSKPGRQAA
jgi:hypothetical protein